MSKNQNVGDSDRLTQNQNNAMSDDPGDGSRNSFTAAAEGEGPTGEKPKVQGKEQIEEFGRRGSQQG